MTKKLVAGSAVFLAGYLVICIQPAAAVALLPATGGDPVLWNFMQVMFQALLLAGYLIAAAVPVRWRRYLLVAAAAAVLTITLNTDLVSRTMSPAEAMTTVGLSLAPGFVFLCTATITAARFLGGQPRDVAWLYAVSNAGALSAAVTYALAIQPNIDIASQLAIWRVLTASLLVVMAVLMFRTLPAEPAPLAPGDVDLKRRSWWLGGAVPVALSLACTTVLTEELGSHPFVWLGPFSCFLVGLVLGFSSWRWVQASAAFVAPVLTIVLLTEVSGFLPKMPPLFFGLLNLATLLAILVWWADSIRATIPPPERASTFLCWLAFGGLCGGLLSLAFVVALDPAGLGVHSGLLYRVLLDWPVPEYILLLILSAWCLHGSERGGAGLFRGVVVGGYLTMCAVLLLPVVPLPGALRVLLFAVLVALVRPTMRPGPTWAAALVVIVVCKGLNDPWRQPEPLQYTRTLMGRVRVQDSGGMRWLRNGNTLHGQQRVECVNGLAAPQCLSPLGYYDVDGPIGRALSAVTSERLSMGVVGLGAGALAAYLRPGDAGTFYELNSVIVDVASERFGYLRAAEARGARIAVLRGDGRILLRAAPRQALDVLVLDAFSSDNVPAHLLTRQAIEEYFNVVKGSGLLAFHTSSRHFDLSAIIQVASASLGAASLGVEDTGGLRQDRIETSWVFASRSRDVLERLRTRVFADGSIVEVPPKAMALWTDGRHTLLEALRW